MTRRELIAKLGFETDEAPLHKIQEQLEGVKNRLELLVGIEVAKKLFELTERFTRFAEELHVAAVSAGITVEEFQRLSFAAGKSAVSSEEMSGAMARLSRQLHDARLGSESAQIAFAEVGISPEQLLHIRTGADAMLILADRFKAIQDPIQKQALAMQLMGRGSLNMVGFLSQGSAAIRGLGVEANKLGVVLSEHQVEALVKVEHSLTTLWAVFKSVGATIAAYLAPSMEHAVNDFLHFYEINRKLIDVNIRAWIWDITYALGFVYQGVKFVVQSFFDFAAAHQVLVRRGLELSVALIGVVTVIWTVQKTFGLLSGVLAVLTPLITAFGVAWDIATAPVTLVVAGIAAAVVAFHDLFTVLTGGKVEDTWAWKLFQGAKGFAGKALGFLGFGSEGGAPADNLGTLNQISQPNFNTSSQTSIGGAQSYQVNAPITVNVPRGTDPRTVGERVQDAIRGHLDTVYRRTQNSLRPSQAY